MPNLGGGNLKIIIPVKFIIGLTFICLIMFPILLYLVLYLGAQLLTFLFNYIFLIRGNLIIPYQVIFFCIPFGIIIVFWYLLTPEYCKLIIKDNTISNFIFDGTENDGWRESISNVKSVKYVGKEEVQKYYTQFNKSKAILIDFGNYNIKYIYAGLFSKRQIRKLIELLSTN